MASKVVNTRIQLKSDTEANWLKAGPKDGSRGFVPLSGELIVYLPDDTHPFSRLKVGDGQTNVVDLLFVDAGSLNGVIDFLICKNGYLNFPAIGKTNQLYIDTNTNNIYYWDTQKGYIPVFQYIKIATVDKWSAGTMTMASIQNTSLVIENGTAPQLTLGSLDVVTKKSEVSLDG